MFQPLPRIFYRFGRVHETSPGTHTLFPSYTRSISTNYSSVQLSDFGLFGNLIPVFSLKCSKPEFCLILSSDSTSRWTPLASSVSFPLPGGLGTFTRQNVCPPGTPKKSHPKNPRCACHKNIVSFCNLLGKEIEMCRIKNFRSPLEAAVYTEKI